jgi:Raf kinase inhibitor-like YbhB/YbcL family protein
VVSRRVTLRPANPRGAEAPPLGLVSALALAPGSYEIRVGVQLSDGAAGSVHTFVDIPDFAREPLSMSGVRLHVLPEEPSAPRDEIDGVLPFAPTARRTLPRRIGHNRPHRPRLGATTRGPKIGWPGRFDMRQMQRLYGVGTLIVGLAAGAATIAAQAPPPAPAGRQGGPRGPVLSVTTSAFPDGGEVPMRNAGRGENKSPAFEFHWSNANTPADAPAALVTYAVILHDVENSTNRGTTDTLHWSAFNIPGSAKGIAEGLGPGTLPDGTVNGPGIGARGGNPAAYFGPGAGPGPFHHYVFEFYALDTKLNLPATATRDDLLKAMEGHVIGKAAYVGRFHAPNP